MGRRSTICSATGLVLFVSQHGIRLPEFKCQQLLTLGCCVTLDKSLSLSEPLSCLTWGRQKLLGPRRACVRLKGAAHIQSSEGFLIDYCHFHYCHYAAAGSGQGSNSQTLLLGKQQSQVLFLWGPRRSHLHSDHQDLHYLQHQLEGLAALGPKFVTGTHEKVLETAAEVFLFQRGWRRWQSPRLGPISGAGGQEVLSLWGNGRDQWEPGPGRSTANRGGRSHVPAKKELWEI